ncbi:MAG: hypothetical protein ABSH38_04435 [Verrucomicrobiota bacterium]|jgi:uncharacterized protein involved in outer membrane biogenesis
MFRLARLFLRILLYFFIAAVVLVVAAILLLDTMMREVFTSRLHAASGMDAKVRAVHVGLLSPTVTIEGLKLYNTADFGGALCLDMPELRLEYDPAALRLGKLHLPLVRLDLADLTVVRNKQGRVNFAALKGKDQESAGRGPLPPGLKFTGIDTLNLSLGKFHLANLASGRSEEIDFGVKNQIFHNVKSEADLNGLGLLLALRGVSSSGHSGLDLETVLKTLTAQ